MPLLTDPPIRSSRTAAGSTYRENSKRLAQLVLIVVESAELFANEIRSLAQSGVTVADAELSKRLNSTFDRLSEGTTFLHEWHIAMAATFAETFLHDVLVECCLVDPSLLGEADPSASYEEIVSATSLEALKANIYSKWARSFVDDGGPHRWSDRLSRMGVSALPSSVPILEEAWGIRHVIVHHAGVVSAEFVRRHPNLKATVGQRIELEPQQVIRYVQAMGAFVAPIDESFAARIAAHRSREGASKA
jgi:hypothetical protein